MSFYFPKRLRSLRLLVSFLFVGLLYIVYSVFFAYHGDEERVYFGHNLTRNALYFQANTGQHLSLLANHFKQLVEQYENERTNMEKNLRDREAEITLLNNQTKLASSESGVVFKQSVVCGSSDIFLLIQVHSSPNNFMKRHAIRLSWGNLEHFIGHRQGVIVRRLGYDPGGTPHMKGLGMLVVSLRGVNFGFWSRLGCSGQNTIIFNREGLV